MNRLYSLLLVTSFFISSSLFAKEPTGIEGKPILTIFTGYNAGLGEVSDLSGFNVDRAFIGYSVTLPKGFAAKGIVNTTVNRIGDKMAYDVYLKNIQIDWRHEGFFASVGLINLMQFSEQERIWGHRYIFKSFQEEYGFTFCEDIGILAGYQFTDWFAADMAFTNGEGRIFKNANNDFRYGVGMSIKPVEGLLLRGYLDYYEDMTVVDDATKDQISYALFVGYEHARFSVGTEYNRSMNYQFAGDRDMVGYSLYATVPFMKWFSAYGRIDQLMTASDWTSDREGLTLIAGIDYQPIKHIRISPNIQCHKSADDNWTSHLLLSLELKL